MLVATEWFSRRGGLSTFNMNLCHELAAAGCTVFCYVPSATTAETEAAARSSVSLVANGLIPGLDALASLCRRPPLPKATRIDFLIGHGHVTGPAAASLVADFFPASRRIHIFHTAPEETAPVKEPPAGKTRSEHGEERTRTELDLAVSAWLTVAVGPRLDAEWSHQMHSRDTHPPCYQLRPWISADSTVVPKPSALADCLVLGRTDDYSLKGLDIAARSIALARGTASSADRRRILLTVRGVQGDDTSFRKRLEDDAKVTGALVDVRLHSYTIDEALLQDDIRRSTVLLMPSRAEGFGLVGLEALSHGIPILVSSRSGLGDFLLQMGEGARSFVVDTTGAVEVDGPTWAQAITRVVSDPEGSFRAARLLRGRLLEHNAQRIIAEFLEYLNQLSVPGSPITTGVDPSDPDFGDVQAVADILPAAGILSAFARVEGELRRVGDRLAPRTDTPPHSPFRQYLDVLTKRGVVSRKDATDLRAMSQRRNELAHMPHETPASKMEAQEFVSTARRLHERFQLMTAPADFVQLDRRLRDMDDMGDEDIEYHVSRSLALLRQGLSAQSMTWEALLKGSRHAVVLGEPGAGKTWEFRALSADLTKRGARAHFVRLELLMDDAETALRGVDLESTADLLLFLDALDESKLRTPHALENCLSNLARLTGDAWSRLRLVISCRVSDWQPSVDGETLERLLPKASETEGEGHVRLVRLEPLTPEQVGRLARARGAKAPDEFLQELATTSALDLCGRPRDVIDLVDFWNRHGKLGRLGEVLEDNLARKLTQSDTRVELAALSPERARQGAEQLAAAVLLSRTFSIMIPGEVADPRRPAGAIDPALALPTWDSKEVRTLLSRPVFDEATLGRVRFHHRSTAEYLAASWIRRLLSAGCPKERVKGIFFGRVFDRDVIFGATAPVLAWVASEDPYFADLVARQAPEILLHNGDPQALSTDVRALLLRGYAAKYHDRARVPRWDDWATASRFAHADLAPTIDQLIREHPGNADLRAELMRLAAAGKLHDCAPVAQELALDATQDEWVRIPAIDLIVESGSPARVQALVQYLETEPTIGARVLYRLWSSLFPKHLTPSALFASFRRHASTLEDDEASDHQYVLKYQLIPECAQKDLDALLAGFRALVNDWKPGKLRAWALEGMYLTLARVVREVPADPSRIETCVQVLDEGEAIRQKDGPTRSELFGLSRNVVQEASRDALTFRRSFFLHRAQGKAWFSAALFAPLELIPEDFSWLLDDLKSPVAPERASVLKAAFELAKGDADRVIQLRTAVADGATLVAQLDELISPPQRPPDPYQLEDERRRAKALEALLSDRKELEKRIDLIRAGKDVQAFLYIVDRYHADAFKRAGLKWDRIVEDLGPDVAAAVRTGLAAWWKEYEVPTRAGAGNTIPSAIHVGLTGVECHLGAGGSLRGLPRAVADRAVRLATWEINGFPIWIDAVAQHYPDLLQRELLDVIKSELFGPHDHGFVGYVANGPERVANLVTPHIVGLLESQDTEAKYSLKTALALVVNRPEDRARLAAFLPARVKASVGRQAHLLWLTAWLVVDAGAALDFVQGVVDERDGAAADQYFVDLLAFIHGGGLPFDQTASLLEPVTLSRFLSLVYKRIRPAEDENPQGPHSPSRREDAQHQRSVLVQALGRTTSESAYRALLALRDGGSISERSTLDWIDELAEKTAERLGQGKVWTPAQVAEFARGCVESRRRT